MHFRLEILGFSLMCADSEIECSQMNEGCSRLGIVVG